MKTSFYLTSVAMIALAGTAQAQTAGTAQVQTAGTAQAQTAGTAQAQTAPAAPDASAVATPNAITPPNGIARGVITPDRPVDPKMVTRPRAPGQPTMPVIKPPGTAR